MSGFIEVVNQGLADVNAALWDVALWEGGFSFMAFLSLGMAIGFSIYLGGIQVRGFRHAVLSVFGRFDDPNDPGDVKHYQALATALSGTVGLGNIGGVAVAVSIGGPGVTVWMIVIGLLAMASKYAECTLACMFRHYAEDGTVRGGPMYYLEKVAIGGKTLAKLFAFVLALASFGGSNAFQANQVAVALNNSFGVPRLWSGVLLAILTAAVIVGGLKRLANVSGYLVPFMVVGYLACCFVTLGGNIALLPEAIWRIVESAFYGHEAVGSFKGAVIGVVLTQALQRALFSCEAGQGSAAIAHAAAKTDESVREGHVALLEPFIDTVVICTITALTIGVTDAWTKGGDGVTITQAALGPLFGKYFLPLAVALFAYSTILSWWYYGVQAVKYLCGESRVAVLIYSTVYLLFTIVGSVWSLHAILNMAGIGMAVMMSLNGVALVYHARTLKSATKSYRSRLCG